MLEKKIGRFAILSAPPRLRPRQAFHRLRHDCGPTKLIDCRPRHCIGSATFRLAKPRLSAPPLYRLRHDCPAKPIAHCIGSATFRPPRRCIGHAKPDGRPRLFIGSTRTSFTPKFAAPPVPRRISATPRFSGPHLISCEPTMFPCCSTNKL